MFSYSASRAWPQLFPSHRCIPAQTKRNIADEQMCFKNGCSTRPPACLSCLSGGFTHQRGSWRMRMGLDMITRRGNLKHMAEHTCTNTLAKICKDMHTHIYRQLWIFHVQFINERWLQTGKVLLLYLSKHSWGDMWKWGKRRKTELIKKHSQPHTHTPTGCNLVFA